MCTYIKETNRYNTYDCIPSVTNIILILIVTDSSGDNLPFSSFTVIVRF